MKLTRQQAINANCKDCTFDSKSAGGSWLQQVEDCSITECHLHEHRPLTAATKQVLQEERISKMNPEELARFRIKQETARQRMAKSVHSVDKTTVNPDEN